MKHSLRYRNLFKVKYSLTLHYQTLKKTQMVNLLFSQFLFSCFLNIHFYFFLLLLLLFSCQVTSNSSRSPWTASCQASLSFTFFPSLLKLTSNESVMQSNHLILCYLLLLLPSIFPSIRLFVTSRLFASGGQITGASTLASVLPMSIQDWFPFRLTGLTSLLSKGLSLYRVK